MRAELNTKRRAALALLLALSLPATALATGQVGETAADFSLNAAQGGSYTFSEHDGKVRFLFFFGHG
ncbi:peroxiredoxin family protein [bacterium]|nr:peroxiredoxin family protein [bacterium]MBU1675351.1 peroxiredoxin family protein [bacterium]